MNFDLRETAKEHIIITAHRGASGGNIPCNTLAACEIALKQGADMLEVDISSSLDGKLFLFHPLKEMSHLTKPLLLGSLPYSVIKKLHYTNFDSTKTQFTIADFDDFLEQFKGRCFINIDKFWSNPEKIYNAVKRHGMTDQILVKSRLSKNVTDLMEQKMPELPFMPIVSEAHPEHEALMKKKLNYVGVEVLFKNDDSPLAKSEFIEKMHKDNVLVWVNSIIYDYRVQLSGGHSDDTALTESEDYGWGWLADRGFDIIQTDWTGMLVDYLKETGRYFK